jgi:hypothetical protein
MKKKPKSRRDKSRAKIAKTVTAIEKVGKDPLPGNEEPTSDEKTAAEKAAEREAKTAEARKRLERCLKAFPLYYDASGEFWFKLNGRF